MTATETHEENPVIKFAAKSTAVAVDKLRSGFMSTVEKKKSKLPQVFFFVCCETLRTLDGGVSCVVSIVPVSMPFNHCTIILLLDIYKQSSRNLESIYTGVDYLHVRFHTPNRLHYTSNTLLIVCLIVIKKPRHNQ